MELGREANVNQKTRDIQKRIVGILLHAGRKRESLQGALKGQTAQHMIHTIFKKDNALIPASLKVTMNGLTLTALVTIHTKYDLRTADIK